MRLKKQDMSEAAQRKNPAKPFNPADFNIKPNLAKVKGRFEKVEIRAICVGCKEEQQCFITNMGECITDAYILKTSRQNSTIGYVLNVDCRSVYIPKKRYLNELLQRLKHKFTSLRLPAYPIPTSVFYPESVSQKGKKNSL